LNESRLAWIIDARSVFSSVSSILQDKKVRVKRGLLSPTNANCLNGRTSTMTESAELREQFSEKKNYDKSAEPGITIVPPAKGFERNVEGFESEFFNNDTVIDRVGLNGSSSTVLKESFELFEMNVEGFESEFSQKVLKELINPESLHFPAKRRS
jgi:hypothetical protein